MTDPTTLRAADLDRRFYAFALDRLIAWATAAAAAWAILHFLVPSAGPGATLLVVAGALLLVGLALALVAGSTGTSPGRAALGLRLVRVDTGTPIGPLPAIERALVLGVATLPAFGLGAASLAWTAVTDPGRMRRGWHDLVARSMVVDVRTVPEVPADTAPQPRQIVNLTAMRLAPPATSPVPVRRVVRDRSSAPAPARWRVSFDSGETFVVEGLAVVGRRPEPRPGEQVRHVLPLRSEGRSLSRTHAQLQVAPDGVLVVMDRGSTNGSVLIRRGVAKDLAAGRPTTLLPGDQVALGDRRMIVARES